MNNFAIKKNQLPHLYSQLQEIYAREAALDKAFLDGKKAAYKEILDDLISMKVESEKAFFDNLNWYLKELESNLKSMEVKVQATYVEKNWASLHITIQIEEVKDETFYNVYSFLMDKQKDMNHDITFSLSDDLYTPLNELITKV